MAGTALMINLFPGNELEGGPANVWLRHRTPGAEWQAAPLLGAGGPFWIHWPADQGRLLPTT